MTDFPDNPVDGQLFNHPNGQVYTFNGVAWSVVRASGATLQALVNRVSILETQLQQQSFLLLE